MSPIPFAIELKHIKGASHGSYSDDGFWIAGDQLEEVKFSAYVEPLSMDETTILPEGDRSAEGIRIITQYPLKIVAEPERRTGDKVRYLGAMYEVQRVMEWNHGGMGALSHIEALAVKVVG